MLMSGDTGKVFHRQRLTLLVRIIKRLFFIQVFGGGGTWVLVRLVETIGTLLGPEKTTE